MKASLLALALAIATLQTTLTPPQAGQRGQVPVPPANQPALLTAAQCKCSIEVTVKRRTGEPISDVEVSLTDGSGLRGFRARGGGTTDTAATTTTDSSGHAVFHDLAEGTYLVQAKRDGYFGIADDTYPVQASANVDVGPANQTALRGAVRQPVQQIALNMVQGATISGSIVDANRRPASTMQVGAYQVTFRDGHRVLAKTGTAVQTDDRGDYRMFWFPPGEYYVRTGGPGGTAGSRGAQAGNGALTIQAMTYYPGTTDPKTAIPLVVREGNDLTGINITLQASNGVTVSGTIINTVPGGRVGARGLVNRSIASAFLMPRNSYFWEMPVAIPNFSGTARTARGGTPPNDSETPFEIRGLVPGTYDFYAVFNSGAPVTGAASGLAATYSSHTTIEAGTENITGIQSVIRPGADLKGHVTVTGNPPATAAGRPAQTIALSNFRIQIQPKDNIPILVLGPKSAYTADADGQFTVANLTDAQYYISGVSPLPADAYVSDIRQDAHSVFDNNIITIGKQPESALEVVVSRGGATIQGTVQDTKHNPVASARITLIPDMPRRENVLLYKSTTTNAMGNFNLSGLAPGTYRLFAWERIPAGAEQNAEFMREYDGLGVTVNISPGLPLANIQVPLIPARR